MQQAAPAAVKQTSRILVADDDAALRHLCAAILGRAGHAVTTAADGSEALSRIRADVPDIALIDVWMPGMTGLDVLRELANDPVATRVIIMTTDDTPQTVLESLRQQAHAFLPKPISADALAEVVAQAKSAGPLLPIRVISATAEWVELDVPCERAASERVHDFLMHLTIDLPQQTRLETANAFRELLLNAIEWGGKLDPEKHVRIACIRSSRMLIFRIADPGKGFRLEDLDHAAINNPGDPIRHADVREQKGLRPGGFGLLLTRSLVDELIYNEAHNEVVFVKYLNEKGATEK